MSRLVRRLRSVDARRRELLDEVAAADPAVVAARPADGGWSVLEIVEHLVLAEREVLGDLSAVDGRKPRRRRVMGWVGYLAVLFVLRVGIPVKAPSDGMLPGGGRTLDELRDAWETTHGELAVLAERMGRAARTRAVFRHPVAGWVTLAQAVHMLDVHLRRHAGQIRERLAP